MLACNVLSTTKGHQMTKGDGVGREEGGGGRGSLSLSLSIKAAQDDGKKSNMAWETERRQFTKTTLFVVRSGKPFPPVSQLRMKILCQLSDTHFDRSKCISCNALNP